MMLYVAFLFLHFLWTSSSKQILDATTSLKENFVGVCQNNMVFFNGTVDAFLNSRIDHDNYVIFKMADSYDEWVYYQNLPHSYTWVHYNLSVGLQKGRQQALQWQKPGAVQWSIGPDHPRQNKSNCIHVTQSVVKQPGILYKEMRTKVSEFYIIRKKNVMIHETGILGSQCGYFQFSDTCETKFKFIGRKWWNKCKLELHAENISWSSALDGMTSPLLIYKVNKQGKLMNWKSSSQFLEFDPNGIQFSRHYFSSPIFPFQEYNTSGFPGSYNSITQLFADSSKDSKIPSQSFLESSLSRLCRDEGYLTPLSKPWYPFWQYAPHKVLVITTAWDSNYHHFLIDCIARISPFLDYVRAYPELKIHIRRHEIETANIKYRNAGLATRNRIAKLLRINPNRFISGPYIAEEVIAPRSIKCNEAILHPLQMHRLAQLMLQEAEDQMRWRPNNKLARNSLSEFSFPTEFPFVSHQSLDLINIGNSPKRILIQNRECSLNILPKEKEDWRCWTQQTFEDVVAAFKKEFPFSEILSLSNNNSSKGNCLECELVIYRDVNLLVGVHGAGMTNIMFMPPGKSVVLEITGIFDGRMLPVCGFHGPLAAMFGVHHLIHHYDSKAGAKIDIAEAADKAKQFFAFLQYN